MIGWTSRWQRVVSAGVHAELRCSFAYACVIGIDETCAVADAMLELIHSSSSIERKQIEN